ncbi:MAG: monofunctional biosynthetic peptidoglycan transglycosylase [Alphaproteobacteria bacterium]|nr:monofunctional biosynthetic peptidoglycan transglycosylase [Alphaproteobacteria bacterium]MCB9931106.1 monofunctional biosynthetic peptidoglycan transglycosylase [Alphaproteobacteria bacterium]
MRRLLRHGLALALVLLVALPLALTLVYRFVPPPATPLMLLRRAEGASLSYVWAPLDAIAPGLPQAAIAAEDNRFCAHFGLDLDAIRTAWEDHLDGAPLRGASTITQQTAKNLFLWPGRDWLRKGLEAYLALMLEALWPKQRILEVYLNVAEFDDGVYGAEAAARHYFGTSAARLSPREAALLAAILPNPRDRSAAHPSPAVAHKAAVVQQRIRQLGPLLDCARPG